MNVNVKMNEADLAEAIEDWGRKKFPGKRVGAVELNASPICDRMDNPTGAYSISASFDLSDVVMERSEK